MKVNLEYETIDEDDEKQSSKVMAVMEIRPSDYRLVFVEDLSGDGHPTKSTMFISPSYLRLIRGGELSADYMFSRDLVHNTNLATPYGNFPMSITTTSYEFSASHPELVEANPLRSGDVPEDYLITAMADYKLSLDGRETTMTMKVSITKA